MDGESLQSDEKGVVQVKVELRVMCGARGWNFEVAHGAPVDIDIASFAELRASSRPWRCFHDRHTFAVVSSYFCYRNKNHRDLRL